jgi:hypothetical protein
MEAGAARVPTSSMSGTGVQGMTERERTIIRVAGLAVHALGLVLIVAGLLAGAWSVGITGAVLFVVGGAWGWGMVAAAANEAEKVRAHERAHSEYLDRRGLNTFSTRFDDEPERPAGPVGGPGAVWPPDGD